MIQINSKYYRPTELDTLKGDYTKAKNLAGWEPKVQIKELVKVMIRSEIDDIFTKSGVVQRGVKL